MVSDVLSEQIKLEPKNKIIATANKLGMPIIKGSMGYSGGMVFDVPYNEFLKILTTFNSDSLLVIDETLVTDEDIEFTKYLDDVDLSEMVGLPKYLNYYLREGSSNTWIRSETQIAQIVLDYQMSVFEAEYDESYEDFDVEGMLMYEDISDEKAQEIAISIARDTSFGSLKNWKQREQFTAEVIGSTFEKKIDPPDISRICNLAHDYRELFLMPDTCKTLKAEGKSNKEIGELVGITAYKASKYLLVETPAHIKEVFS